MEENKGFSNEEIRRLERHRSLHETMTGKEDTRTLEELRAANEKFVERVKRMLEDDNG